MFAVFIWNSLNEYIVHDDEIALKIKFDINEDIGFITYKMNRNGMEWYR